MAQKDLSFTTPQRELGIVTPFVLDGETLSAVEPKASQLLAITRGLSDDDMLAEVGIIDAFMDLCLTEETATRLRERMDDPQDPFDLDTLTNIIQALQGAWSKRPTGPSGPSSQQPRRTGKASTARARRTG